MKLSEADISKLEEFLDGILQSVGGGSVTVQDAREYIAHVVGAIDCRNLDEARRAMTDWRNRMSEPNRLLI